MVICHIQTTNPQPATTPRVRSGNRTTVRKAKSRNSLRLDAINGSWDITHLRFVAQRKIERKDAVRANWRPAKER